MSCKQALVLGASGIAGWAFARECLVYPSADTFDRVIALSYRSLSKEYFTFDAGSGCDDSKIQNELSRLDTIDGIDLSNSSVVEKIAQIPGIEKTTHVFYAAYAGHEEAYTKQSNPFPYLTEVNLALLRGAIQAITKSCPNLKFWLQISGTKSYGFELGGFPEFASAAPSLPWKESDLPLRAPFGDLIFYNAQHAELERESQGKGWSFAELIPNMIIGYCPRLNSMSWVQPLGLLLAFYKDQSINTEIAWPGSEATYTCLLADSSQDLTAHAAIHTALAAGPPNPRINVCDNETAESLQTLWPKICSYFGLTGVAPHTNSLPDEQVDTKWVLARKSAWPAFEAKHGLKNGIMESTPWSTLQLMIDINFARYLDLGVLRAAGFRENSAPIDGYVTAFERLHAARLIP